MADTVMVLGSGYAGVMAALRLGRRAARAGTRVVMLSNRDTLLERIRLHEVAAGSAVTVERPLRPWLARAGVQLWVGNVSALDWQARRLHWVDPSGTEHTTPYTLAINATGSRTQRSGVPGVEAHAFHLDGDGAWQLRRRLGSERGPLVVVGGGHTGLELATEVAEAHPDRTVTLVCSGAVGEGLSDAAAAHVAGALARLRVQVRPHQRVVRVDAHAVTLASGEVLACAACAWTAGMEGAPLATQAGLTVNARGQMRVTTTLQSVDSPWLLGAGDCVDVVDPPCAIPMGCKSAMPMGAHAAHSAWALLNGSPPPAFSLATLGYCVSLGRRDAVVDRTHADTTPTGQVWVGRSGAVIKEAVCRFTVGATALESRWSGSYRWLAAPAPQTPGVHPAGLPAVDRALSAGHR